MIFNDSTYTAVEQAMKYEFSGRTMATDLVNPDYVKLADAYGIPGVRAESPAALADAVDGRARATRTDDHRRPDPAHVASHSVI